MDVVAEYAELRQFHLTAKKSAVMVVTMVYGGCRRVLGGRGQPVGLSRGWRDGGGNGFRRDDDRGGQQRGVLGFDRCFIVGIRGFGRVAGRLRQQDGHRFG